MYRKLSLELAQDRLKTKTSALFNYLQPLELTAMPQQVLNEYQDKKLDTELEGVTLGQKMMKILNTAIEKIDDYLPDLYEKHNAYVQPFKTFAKIAILLHYLVTAVLIIPLVFIVIAVLLSAGINLIQQFLFDKITDNQIDVEKYNYIESSKEYAEARHRYLESVRDDFIKKYPQKSLQYKAMNDDELMEEYVKNRSDYSGQAEIEALEREIIKNEIKRDIPTEFNIFIESMLRTKALFHHFLKPLPQGIFNKLVSIIIVKPFQLLVGTLLNASLTAVEAFLALNILIGWSGAILTFGFHVGALVLINSPLFIIDAFRACFKPANSEKQSEEEFDYSLGSSSSTMLALMPPGQSPRVNISEDHGQSSQSSNKLEVRHGADDIYGSDVWLTPEDNIEVAYI